MAPEEANGSKPKGPLREAEALIGLAGLVYATGYVVLAAHHYALGLTSVGLTATPTEITALVSNAWEFLWRGLLVVVVNVAAIAVRALVSWPAGVGLALVVVLILVHRSTREPPWLSEAWRKVPAFLERRLGTVVLLLLLVGVVHTVTNTLSLTTVSSLLAAPERPVPPILIIPGFLRRSLAGWWTTTRSAIVGDGVESDSQSLESLFTRNAIVAAASLLAYFALRNRALSRRSAPLLGALFWLGLFHTAVAPAYYGVLLKEYRYPRVHIVPKEKTQAPDEFELDYRRPPFLLALSEDAAVLYRSDTREIKVLSRDSIESITIIGKDFLFAR